MKPPATQDVSDLVRQPPGDFRRDNGGNAVRGILVTVGKAVLVTAVTILGFGAGGALGLPVWLHPVLLLPAMLLFFRLSGERRPALWKLVGFVGLLAVPAFLLQIGFRWVPERYLWIPVVLLFALIPFRTAERWGERVFGRRSGRRGESGAPDGDGPLG